MQKTTHKPARVITSGRAQARTASARPAPGQAPVITRITHDLDLIAPHGCRASVMLKLVERDEGHRYYEWWLVVGRHGPDTVSVKYKADGADTIRVDVPEGMPLKAEALQPHVAAFLANERVEQPDTPIIRD
jgi:hypothetical protein